MPVRRPVGKDPGLVKWICIAVSMLYLGVLLLGPLAVVFGEALRKGIADYWHAIVAPEALAAIQLTAITAAIAVPLNMVFGVAASCWFPPARSRRRPRPRRIPPSRGRCTAALRRARPI